MCNDFCCGEKVVFEDKYFNIVVGIIVCINECIVSIDLGDGIKWCVGFGLLCYVFDI